MTFSERLKAARNNEALTQKQVAEQIGLTTRNYQRYEAGTQEPTLSNLVALSNCFNVSIDYLAGIIDNPQINA